MIKIIIISMIILVLVWGYGRMKKDHIIKPIEIDKVSELSLKEQLNLLHKEKRKMRGLCTMYNRTVTVVRVGFRKYLKIDKKEQLKIEEMLKIVENNISCLHDLIYGPQERNGEHYE